MYMFFWFFKQLYYSLKRITKKGLTLLFIFFVIFMIFYCKKTFAFTGNNGINYPDPPISDKPFYCIYMNSTDRNFTQGNSYLFIITSEYDKLYVSQYNYLGAFTTPQHVTGATHNVYLYSNGSWVLQNTNYAGGVYYPSCTVEFSSIDIYNNSGIVIYNADSLATDPVITNTDQEIEEWTFDYLTISCGDWDPQSTFYLHCNYEGYTFTINVTQYVTISNNVATINIPKNVLNESIVLRDGFEFAFGLQARQPNLQNLYVDLNSYTMQLTGEQQTIINEDSDKQVMSDIKDEQTKTNEKLDNIEETLTNSDVDNDSIFLPTLEVEDPTMVGVNQVFDLIYQAFTSGDDAEIVLPFPFTNQVIRIPRELHKANAYNLWWRINSYFNTNFLAL